MKHLWIFALLFTGLIACDNDTAYEVEEDIETAFELEYPDATKASWRADEANGYYDVVFVDKGDELTARYDRNGKRVRTDNRNDDYDRRSRAVTTSTRSNSGSRNMSDFNRETQTKLTSIGYRTDVPMLETEGDVASLSDAVKTAVSKDYSGWTIHKVKQIEQEGRKLMKLELKSEALDKEVKPMYTVDGQLVGIDD